MKIDLRHAIAACAIAAAITWAFVGKEDPSPKPPDRPFLTAIVRMAKNLLWIAMFADPPPDEYAPPIQASIDGEHLISHERSL